MLANDILGKLSLLLPKETISFITNTILDIQIYNN